MPAPNTQRAFPKRHRLAKSSYSDPSVAYHVTIRAFPGTAPFAGAFADAMWNNLVGQRAFGRVELWAACLMPDHLHLLVSAASEPVDQWTANFKSYTTRMAHQYAWTGRLWQPSFYDRRIGEGEIAEVAAYIRSNPMLAGLVGELDDWPWQGTWID